MKKLSLILVLSTWTVPCFAQTTQPPKPGAEQQALQDFFVGTWSCEFSTVKGAVKQSCEMTLRGFFLECRQEGSQGVGLVSVAGYRPEQNSYTMFRYWANGSSDFGRGWLHGNTWTYVFDNEVASGKTRRRQVTITGSSPPGAFTTKWETSVEGEAWQVTQEGKCTKTK